MVSQRSHLQCIGIICDQTIPSLTQFLRRLVVEEWTGTFRSEYHAFLTDTAIKNDAQEFLTDGRYSTSLGDAMPLAMANVLQPPLLIFAQGNLLIIFRSVPRNYRCKGSCGGTAWKDEATIQDSFKKRSRQTRKRGGNPIHTAPDKKRKPRRARKAKHFGVLHYCFYCGLFFRFMFGL